ncbi:MAG: class I SAM-dependent DNA methyltransferase [Clostridiales bacterium]|nr:class I SAM-dependent DNA methyltransferase [Clostridiales bacterium]
MTDLEIKKNAKAFADFWKDKGYEKGESQKFWIDLLEHVLGIDNAREYISFEDQIKIDKTSFIDGYIPSTKVLIEQKSSKVDLNSGIKQSDGSMLTPYQQALRYNDKQVYSKKARWIITCNFKEFYIYDMEKSNPQPEVIQLKDLPKEYYRLEFIVNKENENIKKEMEISIKAGELVGILYDALLKQYNEKDEEELKSLNELCVRLVFCLYAEDSGLFGEKLAFHNYIQRFAVKDTRRALIDLFKVLDTKIEDRDRNLDEDLAKFPYVNGGLFANENTIIPHLTDEIIDILLHKASEDFDWSEISPTIFGAVFESTLNPETRRSGGMHYTSIENIHKVIDPLFLDDLKKELEKIKEVKVEKLRKQQLEEFTNKLSKLTFLDPACGSGNFLTETYISLRRLENEALITRTKGQTMLDFGDVIKVSIGQFYGIEINDFAVTVAKTALWISEAQMMKETEMIVNRQLEFFPLKSYANIVEANALRIDWNEVVSKQNLTYIMGNPPFVGARLMDDNQKQDIQDIFGKQWKNAGNLDYVSCWYKKASDYIQSTKIRVALVSTNSICQGESVANLWKPLFEQGVHIDFAHTTFRWDSEASSKAHVHCVIVGFSIAPYNKDKIIFTTDRYQIVKNINAYLIDAENVFVENRKQPLCNVNEMLFGSMPNDNGFLSSIDEKEMIETINKYPESKVCFKKIVGAVEFINNKTRWCLWLKNVSPKIIQSVPFIREKVLAVKEVRENSNRDATKKLALTPSLFGEIRQPDSGNYLLVPSTSSERRRYIPIGFLDADTIATNANLIVPNASLYEFGVLTSNVHNGWMRAVAGRLKSDYRYSASIVYNNFPWTTPTKEQRAKIEKTAQAILNARNNHPECSLAELYDAVSMPPDLTRAHQDNDRAVMEAYGFWGKVKTESECVAELMKMYQKLTKE